MARNYRLKYWNYKGRGIYMITMNIEGRVPLLGELQGGTDDARVEYSSLGKIISEQIEMAFEPYTQIQICAKQLMPDHLHFVVWVQDEIPVTIGEIIRKMKIGCTHAWWEEKGGRMNATCIDAIGGKGGRINATCIDAMDEKGGRMNATCIDAIGGKGGRINATCIDATSLFEQGFHDRVLLHAGQLRKMIDYVHDNPRRAAIKRANPDLFKLRQAVEVAGFECMMLGNQFLLDDPMKEVLQCSRSLTQEEIEQKKQECMRLAERGVIFVSAGISEGEKQICRALREAGYPMIVLLSEGFPAPDSEHAKYYKPQGVYFEACAAGRLLLIEPSQPMFEDEDIEAEVHAKAGLIPHTSMRYRFLALNAMVRRICK